MTTMIATLIAALACGYCGGWLHRGSKRRRRMIPNGSALQQQGDPVWSSWTAEHGKALKR